MFTSIALLIGYVALSSAVPQPIVTQPAPVVRSATGPQADLAPDESENLVAEVYTTGTVETPREWKKRMVRPCTRVGNRVTC
jgi:hypothetical protein